MFCEKKRKDGLSNITPLPLVDNSRGLPGMKEQKWIREGLIAESLPNGMFRVRLDNEDLILGYVSGRIRRSFIRILPGDRVKIEVSRYDSTKGRIIYRLRNKDSND
uniref:translational initiation factor 1 n=1 Tax=Helleborus torquatus TaxID=171901 RepID=UPI0025A953DA|nr:translational initiation factor 1 [Helleborus torquatus]WIW41367.1 translational initiation factor 1 [Helleborus atrorubens]WIW41689.1 translational initiation factor 1 [Helleborus torquatus]